MSAAVSRHASDVNVSFAVAWLVVRAQDLYVRICACVSVVLSLHSIPHAPMPIPSFTHLCCCRSLLHRYLLTTVAKCD